MNFGEFILSLPNQRTDTIKKIVEETKSASSSVYMWMSGKTVPPKLKRKIISDIIGLPEEELFPETKKKQEP